jgi:hypothetical protein
LSPGANSITVVAYDESSTHNQTSISLTIHYDLPVVTLTATNPTATEHPLTTGTFTVIRTGSTTGPLAVYYSVSGTASPGSDYISLPGITTIPDGLLTATITVTPIDDAAVEGDETVIVTLSANAAYTIGLPNSATVTISDDDALPTVSIRLPKTGQRNCYDSLGNVIPCAGTGQDGDVQAGAPWPNPRFTDNGDGTITDNLTGLMWTKDANLWGSWSSWLDALEYIAAMNAGFYGHFGYTDWRLPNINEIESLANANEANSATWLTGQGFDNVQFQDNWSFYWSATTDASYTGWAWRLDFWPWVQYAEGWSKGGAGCIWPVRSTQSEALNLGPIWKTGQTITYALGDDGDIQTGVSWPTPRFIEQSDGTVSDNLTGLMWTKGAHAPGPAYCNPGQTKTWEDAFVHVICLNSASYLGYSDWRLPNRKELLSLTDRSSYDPALPTNHPFVNVEWYYWSSTTDAGESYKAWSLNAYNGSVLSSWKSYNDNRIWPVRSLGQVPSVTIVATDNTATEAGTTTGTFTVNRTGSTVGALTVYYSVSGTAGAGSDYNFLPGSVSIPDGSASATITVTPIDDTLVEADETVIVTLTVNAAYTVDAPDSATVTIISDDITLIVNTSGTGTGTVTSNPQGINCGNDCSEICNAGTVVALTATPDANSVFSGWTGDADCSDGQVTMDAPKVCTARFDSQLPAPFDDVPSTDFAYDFIMAIANAGITGGCSTTPRLFCPDQLITRGQMAVFLVASLQRLPNACVGQFVDVPIGHPFCGFVEKLASDGITGGCGGNSFCLDDPVTRGQMAVFIVAALGNAPNVCADRFADVPANHSFCGFIERLADDGITGGCGGNIFCPDAPVTRAQMAVFLVAAPDPLFP